MPGNCVTQRALNASPKPKATSSTWSYDARVSPSAVIGSLPTQRANSDIGDSGEDNLASQKAAGGWLPFGSHATHAGGDSSKRSPFWTLISQCGCQYMFTHLSRIKQKLQFLVVHVTGK